MNRRTFLTRVSTGLVAAAVTTHVPVKWLPRPIQKWAALDYMRMRVNLVLNDMMKWNHDNPTYPRRIAKGMLVTPWLFEQFIRDMQANSKLNGDGGVVWTDRKGYPFFKALLVDTYKHDEKLDPRSVNVLTEDEWARHIVSYRHPAM
jgi:hypothetical protein